MNAKTAFSLERAVSNILTGLPGRQADLSDPSLKGDYIGINPLASAQGATFKESKIEFSLDEHGIVLEQALTVGSKVYNFHVHYTLEWVFHLEGWGVERSLSVRQHKKSDLAALIFTFPPRMSFAKYDAMIMLGEGIPAVLGLLVRKERGWDWPREKYAETYQPAESEVTPNAWLPKIDYDAAEKILESKNEWSKKRLLENLGQNLWTGTEEEVCRRLLLIERGLKDSNEAVRCEALSVFTLGGRVTGAVPLVLSVLSEGISLPREVLAKAIDAASCLKYEADKHLAVRDALITVHGYATADIEQIHLVTKGIVSPDLYEMVKKVAEDIPPSRSWTKGHSEALGTAIQMAKKN
jgi:hypothetical protein